MAVMAKRRELNAQEMADAKRLKAAWLSAKPELGLSQEQVAFQCGWKTQGAFTQYLNGAIPLNLDALLKIATVIKADPRKISPRLTKQLGKHVAAPPSGRSGIPIVGTTQAGPDREWVELGHPAGYGDEYIDMISKDANAYALHVRGSSMAPRYREGDVILVEPNSTAAPDDDVVVKTIDGQVMVKTLVSNRNDQVILASIAEGFDRIVLPFSKVEFIHPVGATVPPRSIFKRKAI